MSMSGFNDRQLLGKLKAFYSVEAQQGALPPEWWEQALARAREPKRETWRFSPSRGPLWRLAWVALLMLALAACGYAAATVIGHFQKLDDPEEVLVPDGPTLLEHVHSWWGRRPPELLEDWEPDPSKAELVASGLVGDNLILVLTKTHARNGTPYLSLASFELDPDGHRYCLVWGLEGPCPPDRLFEWRPVGAMTAPMREDAPTFVYMGPYVGYVNVDTEQTVSYEAGWWRGRRTIRVDEPEGVIMLETWAREPRPAQP